MKTSRYSQKKEKLQNHVDVANETELVDLGSKLEVQSQLINTQSSLNQIDETCRQKYSTTIVQSKIKCGESQDALATSFKTMPVSGEPSKAHSMKRREGKGIYPKNGTLEPFAGLINNNGAISIQDASFSSTDSEDDEEEPSLLMAVSAYFSETMKSRSQGFSAYFQERKGLFTSSQTSFSDIIPGFMARAQTVADNVAKSLATCIAPRKEIEASAAEKIRSLLPRDGVSFVALIGPSRGLQHSDVYQKTITRNGSPHRVDFIQNSSNCSDFDESCCNLEVYFDPSNNVWNASPSVQTARFLVGRVGSVHLYVAVSSLGEEKSVLSDFAILCFTRRLLEKLHQIQNLTESQTDFHDEPAAKLFKALSHMKSMVTPFGNKASQLVEGVTDETLRLTRMLSPRSDVLHGVELFDQIKIDNSEDGKASIMESGRHWLGPDGSSSKTFILKPKGVCEQPPLSLSEPTTNSPLSSPLPNSGVTSHSTSLTQIDPSSSHSTPPKPPPVRSRLSHHFQSPQGRRPPPPLRKMYSPLVQQSECHLSHPVPNNMRPESVQSPRSLELLIKSAIPHQSGVRRESDDRQSSNNSSSVNGSKAIICFRGKNEPDASDEKAAKQLSSPRSCSYLKAKSTLFEHDGGGGLSCPELHTPSPFENTFEDTAVEDLQQQPLSRRTSYSKIIKESKDSGGSSLTSDLMENILLNTTNLVSDDLRRKLKSKSCLSGASAALILFEESTGHLGYGHVGTISTVLARKSDKMKSNKHSNKTRPSSKSSSHRATFDAEILSSNHTARNMSELQRVKQGGGKTVWLSLGKGIAKSGFKQDKTDFTLWSHRKKITLRVRDSPKNASKDADDVDDNFNNKLPTDKKSKTKLKLNGAETSFIYKQLVVEYPNEQNTKLYQTRGLGFSDLNEFGFSSVPDLVDVQLSQNQDNFLVMASSQIWDTFDNAQAVIDFVADHLFIIGSSPKETANALCCDVDNFWNLTRSDPIGDLFVLIIPFL